ncbi:MAG: hypothetical protein ABIU09_05240 [Pyrinomonadaceae bacterium]
MKTELLFIFATAFWAVTLPVFAQSERISEAKYNTALAKALESASPRNRRVLTMERYYNGEQLTGKRKIVSEFTGADAKKIEVTEEFGDSKSKKDAVRIGEQIFCRDGNKGWKKAGKDCSKIAMLAIPDGNYEYSFETDSKDSSRKIYTRSAAFVDTGSSPERDAVRLKSIEIKFMADENGVLEYTEIRRGGIEPAGWSSIQLTTYEYDPKNLRISDPTKENL